MVLAEPIKGIRQSYEQVTVRTRAEWRQWLAQNHPRTTSIWLVTFKKGSGQPTLPYAEIVEEALCFGWVDSRPAKLDEHRSMLLISPRRRGSGWSRVNKERVARLIENGLMMPPGLAKIEGAQADGSWTALDEVEQMVIPPDVVEALAANSAAQGYFNQFNGSSIRGILQWISSAKRPETRAKRIAETVRLAAQNIKANQPLPKA
ncbi:MAG: YdeI/OmpD-associated family protein [Acidobacteria bacterium]|nr:YdeI/OmpD-associated family protein [Acidobacteriota bacterium]